MFVQIIQGTVTDADALQRSVERWRKEIKPGAHGYLGSTGGVTPDGRGITMVRFESEADAQANSDRPEQSAWWNEASKAFGDDVTFHNSTEIESLLGGGNDAAGSCRCSKDIPTARLRCAQLVARFKTSSAQYVPTFWALLLRSTATMASPSSFTSVRGSGSHWREGHCERRHNESAFASDDRRRPDVLRPVRA